MIMKFSQFTLDLNSESVKNTYKKLLAEIHNISKIESKPFYFINNSFVKKSLNLDKKQNPNIANGDFSFEYSAKNVILNSYKNFIELNNYFEFTHKNYNHEDNSNRKKSILEMLNIKKPLKSFAFIDKTQNISENKLNFLRHIIKKQKEILELSNFDLFYIKNYSDDFVKLYTSEIFKFVMNVIYTYISPSQDEINKNLKNTMLMNLFLKDHQLAGIYQILTKFKKEIDANTNILKTKALPNITYGSVVSMNVLQKKDNLDPDNIVSNFYVQILFDFKVIKTFGITELLGIIVNYISNDPSFFANAC